MKTISRTIIKPGSPAVLVAAMLAATTVHAQQRWYTKDQVQQGARVFAERCASCHGAAAQGLAEDWKKPGPDGKYPPPPLNGTAHAWHHPMAVLRRTIRNGGIPLGGVMPPFKDLLSDAEIDAAIAFFQDQWSDDIYATWRERNGAGGPKAAGKTDSAKPRKTDITARLSARAGGAPVGKPESTPVAGVLRVKVGGSYVYISQDGRYAFTGDLLDLETGANLTEPARNADRLEQIGSIPVADRVIYPAQGRERAVLVVLTDTTCPFCRKLHAEVPDLQAAGVSVHYIPFPRGGMQSQGAREMSAVWCAEDRAKAMSIAKGTLSGKLGSGECAAAKIVEKGLKLGQELGIRGTPAIVLPDGTLIPGYRPASRLLQLLGLV